MVGEAVVEPKSIKQEVKRNVKPYVREPAVTTSHAQIREKQMPLLMVGETIESER